jgi:hypothetical protein
MNPFKLKQHGLSVTELHRNLSPSALFEHATRRGDSKLMKKFLSPVFVLLASVVLASAEPGTVIRVYTNSFLVRSTITPPSATHPRGTHRIEHFIVTAATKFFVNGNKGSFADVKNGVHVNVKSHSGVDADRVDIVP